LHISQDQHAIACIIVGFRISRSKRVGEKVHDMEMLVSFGIAGHATLRIGISAWRLSQNVMARE
jgi:hypothetical protein